METITIKSVVDNIITAEKTIPMIEEKKETTTYDLGFLLKQREQIQSDYDRDAAILKIRQEELDYIDKIINEAKSLGAEEVKPIEPIINEEIIKPK
jgi:hypothetical protein